MTRLILACLLLAASACATAQSYVPLQPTHWGNWYDPANVGEGLELSVIDDGSSVMVAVETYLIHEGVQVWFAAQGVAADRFREDQRYEFVLYERPAANGEPASAGSLWLRPRLGGSLDVDLTVSRIGSVIHRAATFHQLTMPIIAPVGVCNWAGHFPRPPDAGRFCHD